MESKINYTVVGLIVLLLTARFISGALWLSIGFDKKKYNMYLVYMSEAVSGLSEESPVKYNGVKVGQVKKIELDRQDPQQVKLLLAIEDKTPITISTNAVLISQGITGTTYVGLTATSANLKPLKKLPHQRYPIIPAQPSLFHQLDSILKEVSENINNITVEVKKVFDDENAAYLKKTLANASILSNNLREASDNFPLISKELRASIQKMNSMASELANAGHHMTSTMQSGQIALEQMSQQAIPPAITLIHQLNHIAENLEKVSRQMRQNPAVLIRGSTPPTAGPGE